MLPELCVMKLSSAVAHFLFLLPVSYVFRRLPQATAPKPQILADKDMLPEVGQVAAQYHLLYLLVNVLMS